MFGRMSKRTKIVVGAVVALVALLVLAVVVYLLTRDEAPEAVDLEATVTRIEEAEPAGGSSDESSTEPTDSGSEASSTDASADSSTDDPAAADTTDSAAAADDSAGDAATSDTEEPGAGTASSDQTVDAPISVAGVWTVEVAEGAVDLLDEPTVSFAGFRVDEVLAGGIGDFTAVGRTADVSGSIELTDTTLAAATVEVTMATLRTDNSNRDSRMRQALDTSGFPSATFTLTEPVDIGPGAPAGEAFSGSAVGELTIKGVTNQATFELEAQLVGDSIVAVGSSEVVFSDYGVTAPTAPIVVSVEDHGIMEFQLIFTR